MRATNVGHAAEIRRGAIEREGNAVAQFFKLSGEVQINGTGEAAVVVSFPIIFVDKPLFSHGFELGPGQPFVTGNLPVSSVHILRWEETVLADGTVTYSGALFGIVSSGPAGQVLILQWHMEGTGLQGPVPTE